MDGENYESDISDSWSLIDINLNEEAIDVAEALSDSDKIPSSRLKNVKLKDTESVDLNGLNDFDNEFNGGGSSLSDSVIKSQDVPLSTREEISRDSEDEGRNESGDSESVEILDLDAIDRDTDLEKLDISIFDKNYVNDGTYHSDDEESFCERNINNVNKSTNSTVIRKRRQLNRHSVSSKDGVNSDCPPDEKYSNTRPSETEERDKLFESNSHPVYKHYRNNVANTVLSLSMGVIFAGVACIAIGHFLGVQDAAETVVELMEEIKKLQTESIALQSRLIHINKAFITQETDSKLELPPKNPENEITRIQNSKFESTKSDGIDFNIAESQASVKSFEWLSKLHNLLRKRRGDSERELERGREIDFEGIGKYIHDQINFINSRIKEGVRLKQLEDSDRRVSKELNSIMERLSATQNNIKKLYQRVMKLRDRLTNKVNILGNPVGKAGEIKIEKSLPVRERDLHSIQWSPEGKEFLGKIPKSVTSYEFPQPEEYYAMEKNLKSIIERQTLRNNTSEMDKKQFESEEKKKKRIKRDKKKEGRKGEKKKKKEKKREKKEITKGAEKGRRGSNETKDRRRKPLTLDEFKVKGKTVSKKQKKLKSRRSFAKGTDLKKKKFNWLCSGTALSQDPRCFNLTGNWVFEWADGREEYRRHQTLSDWQFERAKRRKELRDEETNENWQFERARKRRELRDEDEKEVTDMKENRQSKKGRKQRGLRDEEEKWETKRSKQWHREKPRGDYNGKRFLHEDFSFFSFK